MSANYEILRKLLVLASTYLIFDSLLSIVDIGQRYLPPIIQSCGRWDTAIYY